MRRKPPKSPNSSPNRSEKRSPNDKSYSKDHNSTNDDSSTNIIMKRSPSRKGIISRFSKTPHKIKQQQQQQNQIFLNSTGENESSINSTEPITIFTAQVNF